MFFMTKSPKHTYCVSFVILMMHDCNKDYYPIGIYLYFLNDTNNIQNHSVCDIKPQIYRYIRQYLNRNSRNEINKALKGLGLKIQNL